MTVQDVDIPSGERERRHLGAAAVAAVGVYLVIALSRIIERFFYVVGNYWEDPLAYLRAMLPSAAPEWFVAPLPFAFAVWLGLGVIFPIRARCSTRSVVVQSLLTSLIGLVLSGLFIAAGAYLLMFREAAAYGGPSGFTFDDVLLRVPYLFRSAVTAMTTLLTVGTLTTLSAGLLLRDHLRKASA